MASSAKSAGADAVISKGAPATEIIAVLDRLLADGSPSDSR
jgi:hypothetical protein